ncbi:MAM and LDL-receptor class A domain-containing protein 2 [Trichoplax sp. H2]|nr:MAM and LDL-receptor class A domain-containing protein 2 [Trichoplax sp. H2]|eukprot:RDD37229.1 MAM and LDL-receptor class A domain-containing protein 2 [Trichoplax sp. H2]
MEYVMGSSSRKIVMLWFISMIILSASIIVEGVHESNRCQQYREKRCQFNTSSVYSFSVPPVYYTRCNFDSDTCGWNQLKNIDFFDWTRSKGSLPSAGTRSLYDHTQNNGSGFYMYIDASVNNYGTYADLISPPLQLSAVGDKIRISFYYHAFGSSLGELHVYAVYPRHENAFHILLRGMVGSTHSSNIAIDDISVLSVETSCYTSHGEFYRGTENYARNGSVCQNWHSFNLTTSYATANHLMSNYCRNPFGSTRNHPWCFTDTLTRQWQYCNISRCNPLLIPTPAYPLGTPYPLSFVHNLVEQTNVGRVVLYHNGQWGTICRAGLKASTAALMCQSFGIGTVGQLTSIGGNDTSGVIYVGVNDRYGIICFSAWNLNSADVACRQMGYIGAYSSNVTTSIYPTRSVLIDLIECNGYESSIGQCKALIVSSSSSCLSTSIATASCNSGQKSYTSNNKPSNCQFEYGLCGWNTTGNPTWIWHPAGTGRFAGFSNDMSYLQLVRPPGYANPITAVFSSPPFERIDTSVYITFRYILNSHFSGVFEIQYAMLTMQYFDRIYHNAFTSADFNTWLSVTTTTFRPSSSSLFRINFFYKSPPTSSNSEISVIGLDDIRVYGVDGIHPSHAAHNLTRLGIGCGVGLTVLMFIIAYAYVVRYRRRLERGGRSTIANVNLNGQGENGVVTADTHFNGASMNSVQNLPPPSYPAAINSHATGETPSSQSGCDNNDHNSELGTNNLRYQVDSNSQLSTKSPADPSLAPPTYDQAASRQ